MTFFIDCLWWGRLICGRRKSNSKASRKEEGGILPDLAPWKDRGNEKLQSK